MYDDYQTTTRWGRIIAAGLLLAIGLAGATAAVALVLRADPFAWNQAVTDVARAGAAIGWAIAGAILILALAIFILALAHFVRHTEEGRRTSLTVTRQAQEPGRPATVTATLAGPAGWYTYERALGESLPAFRHRIEAQAQLPGWQVVDAPWQVAR